MKIQRDFDSAAATWDEEPRRVKLAGDITASLTGRLNISPDWHALDLGCGTGLVTMALAPHLTQITAADSSCGMLDKLAEKIRRTGSTNIKTTLRDLARGELPEGRFHLVVSAMMLHHIEQPATLLESLKPLFLPGAWIALADLDAEDGSFHDDPAGVFHHGFSRQTLTSLLANAGFTDISVAEAAHITKGNRTYPVLLALART